MGLDCSHGAWHSTYSAFMAWRETLAMVAGLPPLLLMEGFYSPDSSTNPFAFVVNFGCRSDLAERSIRHIAESLPIRWDCLRPDPLYELLNHSDCDGELPPESCGPIADRLEELLPLLPDETVPGQFGPWRTKTQTFIDGLREAAARNESLLFR